MDSSLVNAIGSIPTEANRAYQSAQSLSAKTVGPLMIAPGRSVFGSGVVEAIAQVGPVATATPLAPPGHSSSTTMLIAAGVASAWGGGQVIGSPVAQLGSRTAGWHLR